MRRLILEYLIRQLLSEEGLTSLNVRSFRGREDRLGKFIEALKRGTPLILNRDGEKAIVQTVKVLKKGQEGDPTPYQVSNDADMATLADVLEKLNSGDKLSFVGSVDGVKKEFNISAIAKTAEFGGKGKGFQRGAGIEAKQEAAMKEKLEGKKTDIIIKGETFPMIDGFKYVTGFKKADFVFTSTEESDIFVQHKDPKHQQLSGIVRGAIAGSEFVKQFVSDVYDEVAANGRLKKRIIRTISEPELQLLAMYGTADGTFSENAVQVYCIGDMKLIGDGPMELKADKIYLYPEIPENEEIVLAATYRGGRNHKSPKGIIPDTRIGVYFKSSLGNLEEDV